MAVAFSDKMKQWDLWNIIYDVVIHASHIRSLGQYIHTSIIKLHGSEYWQY
jgi:hypothetical protein